MKRNGHGGAVRVWVAIAVLCLVFGTEFNTMAEEKLLYDFSDPDAAAGWTAINDVVMGGVSSGGMQTTEDGTVVFEGRVSLENNGGFASIRSRSQGWDLSAYSGIVMRFRGDGRHYKLNLKTDSSFDGIMYRLPFETREGEWQMLRFPFAEFEASFRGRPVPEAPPLDPARIASIGVLISDKQAGPFHLEIARIAAYSEPDRQTP
jgi:monofunctional biosynthetic peptidoglycan transglycosylase